MSTTSSKDRNKKITNFTMKLTQNIQKKTSIKRPISPTSDNINEKEAKLQLIDHTPLNINMANNSINQNNLEPTKLDEENTMLSQALGPLISEFKLLQESVDTVHQDYADLKNRKMRSKSN